MRRRKFITLLGTAAAWPLVSRAQQRDRMRLIGVLMGFPESDRNAQSCLAALRGALAKLGWTEGNNLRIEVRWTTGDTDRIRTLAKELVDLRPDVILGQTTPVTDALIRGTRTIPIVFVTVSDPIASGFATSLARPGGNVTGFALFESSMGGKWVELLKQIAPRTVHVALLFNPATVVPLKIYMPSIQAAASSLAIQVSNVPVHAQDEIEGVIAAQARNPGGGLIVTPDSFTTSNRELISALAARYGVPTIHNATSYAESGGLIAFGTDFVEQFRQVAGYIDRILKGAKPADLPVQNPTKFNLIINLKAAKGLDLDVPLHLQQAADEVIE
jgi:ABC-type uncharacterized transport system substrate-binding protein